MAKSWSYSNRQLIKGELEREHCSDKLINFVERAWHIIEPGTPFINGWAMGAICEHYQAITEGQITRLLVTVPTGLSKSTISQVMHPAWEWGPAKLPHIRIISSSFGEVNAMRDTRKTRLIIASEWYQRLWPLKLTTDQNTKGFFENEFRGFRQCCAVGSMTGKRGDRISWDDPISALNAKSKVELEKANYIFSQVLPTRINDVKKSSISIIMQRLSKNDVAAQAIENGYVHLMLPMEYEPGRKCKTMIGFSDPREEDGELLFPERFPREQMDELKVQLGRDGYASQMLQRPNPVGGSVIKSKDFMGNLYEIIPSLRYREIHADTAMKTKEHNDYSVLQCWGLSEDGHVYLIDQLRGKWEAPDLERMTIAFVNKHCALDYEGYDKKYAKRYGALRLMEIEDKASGTGLIQSVRRKIRIPVKAGKVDKDRYSRVYSILPKIEAGMVHLNKDASYLIDFLDECESFTANDTHIHDDQIDPMVSAIDSMISNNISPWWQSIAG